MQTRDHRGHATATRIGQSVPVHVHIIVDETAQAEQAAGSERGIAWRQARVRDFGAAAFAGSAKQTAPMQHAHVRMRVGAG